MAGGRAVSLFLELTKAQGTLEGVRRALLLLQGEPAGNQRSLQVIVAGGATLSLVITRLALLRRVLEGDINPEVLIADHNAVDPGDVEAGTDLLLHPWVKTRPAPARGQRDGGSRG